ncbi:MAG: hypothetical protein H7328_01585 [Bdellovibrio sp.]|nr:hypothetical protein [Bdellovibrio sp.]
MNYLVLISIAIVVGCASTNELNKDHVRTPANSEPTEGWSKIEEVVKCGYTGTHLFNGKRLRSLNYILDAYIERLESRPQTSVTKAQMKQVKEIALDVRYPAVKAIWHPDRISDILEARSKATLQILEEDSVNDRKTTENINYLKNSYIPKLRDSDYWCPEQAQRNDSPDSSHVEPAVR